MRWICSNSCEIHQKTLKSQKSLVSHFYFQNRFSITKKRTRLHPQGKGGPEGDFLCEENTLNIYHTYHDVTIQNPLIIDLTWKLKIFLYQIVTKIDRFDQKWTRFDHFWSHAHTSVFGGMSVRIANTKSPFGAINLRNRIQNRLEDCREVEAVWSFRSFWSCSVFLGKRSSNKNKNTKSIFWIKSHNFELFLGISKKRI